MKTNEIYLMGAGGNIGCTEKLQMALPDFILVVNDKRYRFDLTDGNLSILCVDGVDEKIGVKQGYKNLVITAPDNANWNPYDDAREEYSRAIQEAKEYGCGRCSFCVDNTVYHVCKLTGEDFINGTPKRGEQCPCVKVRDLESIEKEMKFLDAMGIDNTMKEEDEQV